MLHRPEILSEVEKHHREWKFRGIKVHQCWESFTFHSSRFEGLAAYARENRLPIFIHAGTKRDVRALIEFIRRNPQTRIIIAHLYGLELYMQCGADLENVYFEISTPQLISLERLNKALLHFGPERIIMGSDTPYGRENLRLNIERVDALPISEGEKQLILGKNVEHLLGQ